MQAETRYARAADGVHIAYQVLGDGPADLVFIAGFTSHVEHQWEQPTLADSLRRMASFSRLILFDKRGTGLSDPVPPSQHTLEQRMEDMTSVLDAAGSERAALFGASDGGPMCALFAATHPERVSHLILYGSWARFLRAPDYPIGVPEEAFGAMMQGAIQGWGSAVGLPLIAPSAVGDVALADWWARWERLSASPGTMAALIQVTFETDVRDLLASIRVPTLVLHRDQDPFAPVEHGRYLAEHIPDAKLVELRGIDHPHFVGDTDAVLDEVEEFVTGTRSTSGADRVLATVMFTDIAGSTDQAARLGDRAWRSLLESHDALVRQELARFRGREIKTTGDGFLATFDGPARGVRCARAIVAGAERLGLQVRVGLHTGEVELLDGDIGGIGVHIGARVSALACGGEVLASSTVKDLVVGSGLGFEDRGLHQLKGVPGEWRLYAVIT